MEIGSPWSAVRSLKPDKREGKPLVRSVLVLATDYGLQTADLALGCRSTETPLDKLAAHDDNLHLFSAPRLVLHRHRPTRHGWHVIGFEVRQSLLARGDSAALCSAAPDQRGSCTRGVESPVRSEAGHAGLV